MLSVYFQVVSDGLGKFFFFVAWTMLFCEANSFMQGWL